MLPAERIAGRIDNSGILRSDQGVSRHGRYVRRRRESRGPVPDGSSADRGGRSCEAKALQSARDLPDNRAALELIDDWTSDVAVV